jgi:hypothetical protein
LVSGFAVMVSVAGSTVSVLVVPVEAKVPALV